MYSSAFYFYKMDDFTTIYDKKLAKEVLFRKQKQNQLVMGEF